ncbi:FAD-linked oxidase C-terminal domain-containing protein, partial [Mesorhizobium sp. M0118]|uniref:FAD-binding oxidoreductase n=1 Tax=Mesorhizobium sp. M0118 TaxID=2956884 RepID=UPI003336459B
RGAHFSVWGIPGEANLLYLVPPGSPAPESGVVSGGVAAAGGGVSAEHGIGLDKKEWLHLVRSDAEIAAMRRLKAAFDPNNILNAGRIFDLAPG